MADLDYLTIERPDDDEYHGAGTRTLPNGNVEVRLPIEDAENPERVGSVVPFEMPPDAAVKFAAILLKRAGWDVSFAKNSVKARRKSFTEVHKALSRLGGLTIPMQGDGE